MAEKKKLQLTGTKEKNRKLKKEAMTISKVERVRKGQ